MGAVVKSRTPSSDGVRLDKSAGRVVSSSWQMQQGTSYRIGFGSLRSDTRLDYQALVGFFSRHFGQFDPFLIRDEEDCTVTAHGFGLGDGSTVAFQLQRSLCGKVYDQHGLWLTTSTPRTNLLTYSQDFTNAAWTQSRIASVSVSSSVLAPDGTKTACKVACNNTNGTHSLSQTVAIASGTTYAWSAWAKAAEISTLTIRSTDTGTPTANFDLSAGSVSSTSGGASGTIAAHPTLAGWYCCTMTFTAASSISDAMSLIVTIGAPTSNDGIYLWGAQAEVASARTQYIATTSAAVTVNPTFWTLTTGGGYADGFEPVWDVAPGPSIYVDGTLKTLTTHYSISNTGLVTFVSAPSAAAVLTWSGSYYKRVRFADPTMNLERVVRAIWRSELELIGEAP